MINTGGAVTSTNNNGDFIEDVLLTYDEDERQENQINRENAKRVFTPEFIPFYPKIAKDFNLSTTECLLYGFIRFYMSTAEGGKFYFTNEQLAIILNCGETTINIGISKLSDCKLIEKSSKIKSGGGTMRYITKIRTSENVYSEYQKTDSQSIRKLIANKNILKDNNINNNIYIDENDFNIELKKPNVEKTIKPFPLSDEINSYITEELGDDGRQSFIDYWTEPSKSGKQRWEGEKYFDIKRRIGTWKRNNFGNTPKSPVYVNQYQKLENLKQEIRAFAKKRKELNNSDMHYDFSNISDEECKKLVEDNSCALMLSVSDFNRYLRFTN